VQTCCNIIGRLCRVKLTVFLLLLLLLLLLLPLLTSLLPGLIRTYSSSRGRGS
jgi:hypothetical protein